ncbi:MAG: tetratricopeptide repeat protein [Chitinophagaceae bacterium]|nr:MAG: tetratricopeptide repeat protein [Chitinophagaceae bacterium]
MRKHLLTALLCCIAAGAASAQTATVQTPDTVYTLDAETTRNLLKQLPIDSSAYLRSVGSDACRCIDSVRALKGSKAETHDAVAACIADQSIVYQGVIKMMRSMRSSDKKIELATDPKSTEYRVFYYELESWLRDSCSALGDVLVTNDDINSKKSMSANAAARAAYDKGTAFLRQDDYTGAIPWFEKAVKEDPEFAFAWDNLGISYRKTGQLEKAVAAYQSSLKADPSGPTALQNLAVAYLLLERSDDAIAAYKTLLNYQPDNPEVYYGIGMVYLQSKKDLESALDNLCQAYNIYVKQKSAYRADAEKLVRYIYGQMKGAGKEERFKEILKKHHISPE